MPHNADGSVARRTETSILSFQTLVPYPCYGMIWNPAKIHKIPLCLPLRKGDNYFPSLVKREKGRFGALDCRVIPYINGTSARQWQRGDMSFQTVARVRRRRTKGLGVRGRIHTPPSTEIHSLRSPRQARGKQNDTRCQIHSLRSPRKADNTSSGLSGLTRQWHRVWAILDLISGYGFTVNGTRL